MKLTRLQVEEGSITARNITQALAITKAFKEHYWSVETPEWAKDSFNEDTAATCGDCGAWLEVVRPGKTQCTACEWLGEDRWTNDTV